MALKLTAGFFLRLGGRIYRFAADALLFWSAILLIASE